MEFSDMLAMVQGGGNVALGLFTFFIYKAESRLARIEKALDKYISAETK
jgi:tryptophan synthase beta subunit